MGICGSKTQNRDQGIQFQIEQTVQEQQKIKIEEQNFQNIISMSNHITTLNTHFNFTAASQQNEKNDSETNILTQEIPTQVKKKVKVTKEIVNYFMRIDYVLQIFSLVVELYQDKFSQYYEITIGTKYKDHEYYTNLNGILITQNEFQFFTLKPETFKEANKYSRFKVFFQNDNYFNIDKKFSNSFITFENLLQVERNVKIQPTPQFKNKKPEPQQKEQEDIFFLKKTNEMLEIITVVDIEQHSRFQSILFHLIFQKNFPDLEQYLIFIKNTTFLFDIPPQFDQPTVYRLAIFYDELQFSLKDLQTILLGDKMELSSHLHLKLSLNLMQILIACYKSYCYRLNFTLTSVFYVQKYKSFKLESFKRIRTLNPPGKNLENQTLSSENKKYSAFIKCFKKDLAAITDLIVYFRCIQYQNLKTICKLRKQFQKLQNQQLEIQEEQNYLTLVENVFADPIYELVVSFIKLSVFSYEVTNVDKIIQDIEQISCQIQKQIQIYESQQEQQQNAKEDEQSIQAKINQGKHVDDSDSLSLGQMTDCKLLDSYPINFSVIFEQYLLQQQENEADIIYKELIFQSLNFNDFFQKIYNQFLDCEKNVYQQVYAEILNIFFSIKQIPEESWECKLSMISKQIDNISILKKNLEDIPELENFKMTLLFQIMTLSQTKPINLLNQLQICVTNQLNKKKEMDRKLKIKNQATGLLEQKKYTILQMWYAQSYLNSDNYFSAIAKIQKVIGFQLKNQHQKSLLYGYSLLISGDIARISLQSISAMLNLEMSLGIYNLYFPDYKTIEVIEETFDQQQQLVNKTLQVKNLATKNKSAVQFLLGMSYFEVHDFENALQSLRRAEELLLRSFNKYSDEVVFLVIKQVQIYVQQDDIGQIMKILLPYAIDMNQLYRQGKIFKKKIISQLQFILGLLFEFKGQYLSAIRFIERSNRTLTKSKNNNFIIQMHYQVKKIKLIHKLKDAFIKIKNKQSLKAEINIKQFKNLTELFGGVFNIQFFKQFICHQSSFLLQKYGNKIINSNGFKRNGEYEKSIKFLSQTLQRLNMSKKDEVYANMYEIFIFLTIDEKSYKEIEQSFRKLIEIHERYLYFPFKQQHVLKCQLIFLCFKVKQKNSKIIYDYFPLIEQTIDDFYELIKWQLVPSETCLKNKFETIKRKGHVSIVYQILNIKFLIETYFKLKKLIMENISDYNKLIEISKKYQQQFLTMILDKEGQNIIERKRQCMFGNYSKIKIESYIDIDNEKQCTGKSGHKKSINLKENKQNQFENQQIIVQEQKIILDLRTKEQILEQHKASYKSINNDLLNNQHANQQKIIVSKKVEKEYSQTSFVSFGKKDNQVHKINPFEKTKKK